MGNAVRHSGQSTLRTAMIESPLTLAAVADRPLRLVSDDVQIVPRERSEIASRVMNVTIAALALFVMLPVLALIALAVWLSSKGPVIYMQVRVGEDRRGGSMRDDSRRRHDYGGRLFKMYKFRTMRVDAEANGKAVWAQQNDPRTTSIGAFLRKTRLDELPQLWNVIVGDMNIVGPRPERPSIFAQLREEIPMYAQRQRVKPGITGWAQVNQAYDTCLDDVKNKVQLDLEYVQQRSVVHDLRIMSMTLPVMIHRAQGW